MRRIPTARIGSGCSIGAGPAYPKETIINSNRSRQFPRTGPSVLPDLAVGIPRDANRCFFRPLAFRMTGWRFFLIARDDIQGVTKQQASLQISSHRGRFVRPWIHISPIILSAEACIQSQGEAGSLRKREETKKQRNTADPSTPGVLQSHHCNSPFVFFLFRALQKNTNAYNCIHSSDGKEDLYA